LNKFGFAIPEMLKGVMMAIGGVRSIVIHGDSKSEKTQEWLKIVRERSLPGTVVILAEPESSELSWLAGKNEVLKEIRKGKVGVYICEGFSCGLPISDYVELAAKLDE